MEFDFSQTTTLHNEMNTVHNFHNHFIQQITQCYQRLMLTKLRLNKFQNLFLGTTKEYHDPVLY